MRVMALVRTGEASVDLIDVAVFLLMAFACAAFLWQGGVLGFVGAALGAVQGFRSTETPGQGWRRAFRFSLSGFWAGLFLGGMVAMALRP